MYKYFGDFLENMSTNCNYLPLTVTIKEIGPPPNLTKWSNALQTKNCRMKRKTLFLLLVTLTMFALAYARKYITNNITAFRNNSNDEDDITCQIPKLDPYHPSILKLLNDNVTLTTCEDNYPLLFESTFNSTIVPIQNLANYGIEENCCYQAVQRNKTNPHNDDSFDLSPSCYSMSLKSTTIIPQEFDFISIRCDQQRSFTNGTLYKKNSIMDMHTFVHLKPVVEERARSIRKNLEQNGPIPTDSLNVVILGIDSVSHMNFKRVMPKSYKYLMNYMSAVEMNGVNKIGESTLPNLGAALTGVNMTVTDFGQLNCQVNLTFDDCPMIWKEFAAHGYRTSLGDDRTKGEAWNYLNRGFKYVPTDYYFRPFGLAAKSSIQHGKNDDCYGPRLQFEVLLNYLQKMAHTMGFDRRYFQLIWSSSLTHDHLNLGRFGDTKLLSTLAWFKENGYLNNTMFILMSDHGFSFGSILDIPMGRVEGKMPYLFFVAPAWFKNKYSRSFQNLKTNTNRLTTPFDLHETLSDLVNLNSLSDETILIREEKQNTAEKNKKLPRAISQFLPIPKSRTCQMAGISDHFCICGRSEFKLLMNNSLVQQAANYVVHYLNKLVSKQSLHLCAVLTLDSVQTANMYQFGEGGHNSSVYHITFTTMPGGGKFDATVKKNDTRTGFWAMSGVERTNRYGNQGHCVDKKYLKPFCYCVDLLDLE